MRITIKDLETLVTAINVKTGSPLTPYNAALKPNAGNYHLCYNDSGVKLWHFSDGGINAISTDGYGTKKQLHSWMTAFLAGYQAGQEAING